MSTWNWNPFATRSGIRWSLTQSLNSHFAGPPELVVEIAASSTAYDLYEKKNFYRRNGVREYVVWRVYDNALDWFVLEAGRYGTQAPDDQGVYASRVFPGLRLARAAWLAGDLAAVLSEDQAGMQSLADEAFITQLAARR